MRILLDQPGLAVLISLVAALAAAGLVYWRAKAVPKWRLVLAALRGTTMFVLVFLLFDPLLETLKAINHKPQLLVAIDGSSSIAEPDRKKAEALLQQIPSLKEYYEVTAFSFGSKIGGLDSLTWEDGSTNLAEALYHVGRLHRSNQSTTALILSDGIYNQGADPLSAKDVFPGTIVTWTLGDTTSPADSWIHGVEVPKVVFLNNQFVIDAWFETKQLASNKVEVRLEDEQGNALENKEISWTKSGRTRIRFIVDAMEIGTKRYKLVTSIPEGDVNPANNFVPLVVQVEEKKKDIWLIAGAAHPDIAALVEAVKPLSEYTLHIISDEMLPANSRPAVLLFVHPTSNQFGKITSLLNQFPDAGRGWILGTRESFNAFRPAFTALSTETNPRYEDVYAWPNPSFNLFTQTTSQQEAYKAWPPVRAAVFQNASEPTNHVLLEKIGNVQTSKPIWTFETTGKAKEMLIAAQGIWQWRLAAYKASRDFQNFDQLIHGSLRLLSAPSQANKLKVDIRPHWYQGEQVQAYASFTNNAGQFTQEVSISMQIKSPNGQVVSYSFTPNTPYHTAVIGQLSQGQYAYTANASWGGKKYTANGTFEVSEVDLESRERQANYPLMRALSRNGGAFVGNAQEKLINQLKSNAPASTRELKSTVVDFTKFLPLLIALMLVFLTEITIRRFFGSI